MLHASIRSAAACGSLCASSCLSHSHSIRECTESLMARPPVTQVVLEGHLGDADWKATAKWDNAYLAKHAVRQTFAVALVLVEVLGGSSG